MVVAELHVCTLHALCILQPEVAACVRAEGADEKIMVDALYSRPSGPCRTSPDFHDVLGSFGNLLASKAMDLRKANS